MKPSIPSVNSLFREDSNGSPSGFEMQDWRRIRDFFSAIGSPYRNDIEIITSKRTFNQVEYRLRRVKFLRKLAVIFYIAEAMNWFQEDYWALPSQVSLQGRKIAEGVLTYFEPPDSNYYENGKMSAREKLSHLKGKTPSLRDLCDNIENVLTIGKAGRHNGTKPISLSQKAELANELYAVLTFLKSDVEKTWHAEAARINTRADIHDAISIPDSWHAYATAIEENIDTKSVAQKFKKELAYDENFPSLQVTSPAADLSKEYKQDMYDAIISGVEKFEGSSEDSASSQLDWTPTRDFLLAIGSLSSNEALTLKKRGSVCNIAEAMYLFRENYWIRPSEIPLQGRKIAEGILEYFEPLDAPYPDDVKKNAFGKVLHLKATAPYLNDLCDWIYTILIIGNMGVHFDSPPISTTHKTEITAKLNLVLKRLKTDVGQTWCAEATAVATATADIAAYRLTMADASNNTWDSYKAAALYKPFTAKYDTEIRISSTADVNEANKRAIINAVMVTIIDAAKERATIYASNKREEWDAKFRQVDEALKQSAKKQFAQHLKQLAEEQLRKRVKDEQRKKALNKASNTTTTRLARPSIAKTDTTAPTELSPQGIAAGIILMIALLALIAWILDVILDVILNVIVYPIVYPIVITSIDLIVKLCYAVMLYGSMLAALTIFLAAIAISLVEPKRPAGVKNRKCINSLR